MVFGEINMLFGIGYNSNKDFVLAGKLASKEAVSRSGEPEITFLFTTENYTHESVFKAVKEVIGKSKLVGASVAGIITRDGVFEKGVGVCTASGLEIQAVTCLQKNAAVSPWESGGEVGEKLSTSTSGNDPGTIFIFAEGLAVNISNFIKGMYSVLGPDFSYVGGVADCNLSSFKSYQFTEKGVESNAVAVALVRGIDFQIGIGRGWRPFGQPMLVTSSRGKKVNEIDGRPAFDVYSEYLGGFDKKDFTRYSLKYPLGIPGFGGVFFIREPIRVDSNKAITFAGEIPQNTVAVLMEGGIDEIIRAAGEAAEAAVTSCGSPEIVFVFDSVSRYLLMGSKFHRALEAVKSAVGPDVPMLGILTFGEIYTLSGIPFFDNKSVVIAAGR